MIMDAKLFAYPPQTAFGRGIPKNAILEHSNTKSGLRKALTNDIEQINWAYKLAPETLSLKETDQISEIQILVIVLKKRDITAGLLRAIDQAIPFPLIFELYFNGEVKVAAIYKRRSEADHSQWVLGDMLESHWMPVNSKREPVPIVLDMQGLYEAMLRNLLPYKQKRGESLQQQLARLSLIRQKENNVSRLQAQLGREKQFNRKVEINSELKKQQAALLKLLDE